MKKARALSTICISLFAAQAALAQDIPTGCFSRVYDAQHLAAQPAQVVEAMWLNIYQDPDSGAEPSFWIGALLANQGHAGRDGYGGQIFSESGYCQDAAHCFVYCDGGGFALTRAEGDMIEITTSHMRVVSGSDCAADEGQATTLAEVPGEPTTYRLFRSEDHICARND